MYDLRSTFREGWTNATKEKCWTDFRTVSNTYAARAVILIPLVGYWIIFNEHLTNYTRLSHFLFRQGQPEAVGGLHVPWRLFCTYFGLCLVAAASALYQWRCPAQVKMYGASHEYVGTVFHNISGIEEHRVDVALQEGDDESRRMLAQIQDSLSRGSDHHDAVDARRAHAKRNALQALYDLKNRSYPRTRIGVMWLYRIGFAALAVPSLEIFGRVVWVLVRTTIGAAV